MHTHKQLDTLMAIFNRLNTTSSSNDSLIQSTEEVIAKSFSLEKEIAELKFIDTSDLTRITKHFDKEKNALISQITTNKKEGKGRSTELHLRELKNTEKRINTAIEKLKNKLQTFPKPKSGIDSVISLDKK